MEKIKVICVSNIIRENTYDDVREAPFTIGKIYELSVVGDGKWSWVVHDLERTGHYPMSMFKPLDDYRMEQLNKIL